MKLDQIDDTLKAKNKKVSKKIVMAKRKTTKVNLMIEEKKDVSMTKDRKLEE